MVSEISSKGDFDRLPSLPQGWVLTMIGEISAHVESVNPKEKPTIEFDYLDIASIDNKLQKITAPKKYIGKDAPSRARQLVLTGDILFSTVRTYLKNFAMVDSLYNGQIASTGFCVIRPFSEVDNKYIFYYALTDRFLNPLNELQRGTSYPAVRDSDVFVQSIPLPPLPEQHRIVTKIEVLFTQLDAGVASLKKVQAQLKRYRQTVLKAAFDGRLTQEWREQNKGEIEPAVVFIKRLQEKKIKSSRKENTIHPDISSLPILPESWSYATADQISQQITDGEHIMPERGEIGIPYVSARNVQNGYLNLDSVDHVTKEVYSVISKRLVVESGDVLLSCSGSVGRTCVVPENFKCTLNRSVAIIKPIAKLGKYLSYALRSSFLQRQIDEKKTQTAQANIFQGKIRTLTFPIASQSEQDEIVIEIERRFSQIDHLENTITISLRQAESLRQSILKRAFEGKLVPQNPDDEPASILLERIKAEKTRHAAEAKKGKTLQPKSPKRKVTNGN
ncbi:MAG: restriction endonuclease subunit S [Methanoregula sp.]|nr:restriction endonuclease subunit S [Methanoregula sp.]